MSLNNIPSSTFDSFTIYEKFREKIPELAPRLSLNYFDTKHEHFERFYENILLKWVVSREKGSEKSVLIQRDTRKVVGEWLSKYFPKEQPLICVYPGGQMDLTNPYKHCDPDVLVIVDPQPCAKNLESWKDISERFCSKILRVFKDGEILDRSEFTTTEIKTFLCHSMERA